ncbi:MAG: DUF4124 domain-containing protein [Gammaproteobacteria bacterium]|nr:DUF4124 domain-containing protein [Gammaproteobacteria bacterium]MBU1656206.1 DUF4124 domain-containing protein [Gammaproteobacteria bacterium]MBU1959771.1 DUF4124 domain-containing protein [Gammaproteobacteria bacterium]
MKRSYICIAFILLAQTSWSAGVFKWTDEYGKIHYGDKPTEGAERIKLREPPSLSSQMPSNAPSSQDQVNRNAIRYTLSIASPAPHETIRTADGKISVSLTVDPVPGADVNVSFRFYLDGGLVEGDSGSLTQLHLSGVQRGSHRIRAEMRSDAGIILASSPEVSFFVRQPSLEEGGGSTSDPTGGYKPEYSSNNKAGGSTYSPTKPDYSPAIKANSNTYKPSTPNYSPTNKASTTTYKPSFGSGGFKAK